MHERDIGEGNLHLYYIHKHTHELKADIHMLLTMH